MLAMSKKTIHSLIQTIEDSLDTLEDSSTDIETAISIYSNSLTLAAELTKKLTETEQEIKVLTEKGESIINDLQQS